MTMSCGRCGYQSCVCQFAQMPSAYDAWKTAIEAELRRHDREMFTLKADYEGRFKAIFMRIGNLERDMSTRLTRAESVQFVRNVAPPLTPKPSPMFGGELDRAFWVAFSAVDCIAQCVGLKWPWASMLTREDVAKWMWANPELCRGAFDLSVLERSIDPVLRAEVEARKRQPVDANGSPLPDEGT